MSQQLYNSISGLTWNKKAKSLAQSYGMAIQEVTWEDTARFKDSCWGPNISDMTLATKGNNMPVIRRPNLADLTCDISSENFSVLVGNEKGKSPLTKITLKEYVQKIAEYADNRNIQGLWLERDKDLLLSSQACILPLESGKVNFKVKLFNYQSSKSEPAVLVIVASNQGTSCQVISGRDSLYLNEKGTAYDFSAKRLEDDRKERGVTTTGAMTEEEKARNVIFIYQIPLEIERKSRGTYECFLCDGGEIKLQSMTMSRSLGAPRSMGFDHAMISKGDSKGKYEGTKGLTLKRDPNYPIRLTLQYYYVTDTVDVSEGLMKKIAEQLEKSYTFGQDKSSLVLGGTDRSTEAKELGSTPATGNLYATQSGVITPAVPLSTCI